MTEPLITIYYRVLSNIDETPITGYNETFKNSTSVINYGTINTAIGKRAESPYIIEFDIWNNEPSFSAGMLGIVTDSAQNCKFSIWDNDSLDSYSNARLGNNVENSLVYARCITNDHYTEFKPISGTDVLSDTFFGNVDKTKVATLSGQPGGDHAIIQTKIIIPDASGIPNSKLDFVVNFEFEYIDSQSTTQKVSMIRHISFAAVDTEIKCDEQEEFIGFTDSERISADIIEATHGISGNITLNNGYVSNTKISAFKDNVLYDYSYTDENGAYRLYLEKGIYDIRIENETYGVREIRNYEVKDGIKQYRKTIKNGQIKQKYPNNILDEHYKTIKNVVSFESFSDIENNEKLVMGYIVTEHGEPLFEGAEIIVVDKTNNGKIKAFTKTDANGKYSFTLEHNITYDILIRSSKRNVKKIRNYNFNAENGFLLDKIVSRNPNYELLLNNRGEWIYEL